MLGFTGIDSRLKPIVIYSKSFYSFGPLDMLGVNVEYVYIHPHKNSVLNQVMGSEIQITSKFCFNETFKEIPKSAGQEVFERAAREPAGVIEVELIEVSCFWLFILRSFKEDAKYLYIF